MTREIDNIVSAYNKNPKIFFDRYEGISFEKAHGEILEFLPKTHAKILDIGAGSGRDAAALSKLGYEVVAVEPSVELLKICKMTHKGKNIKWLNDYLPKLIEVEKLDLKFEVILLSGVWMHIKPSDRFLSMQKIKEFLLENGLIVLTFRMGGANDGRKFFPVSLKTFKKFVLDCGLQIIKEYSENDVFNRPNVKWVGFVLKKCV